MINKFINYIVNKFNRQVAYYQVNADNSINLQYKEDNHVLSITEHKTFAEIKKQYKNFKFKRLV